MRGFSHDDYMSQVSKFRLLGGGQRLQSDLISHLMSPLQKPWINPDALESLMSWINLLEVVNQDQVSAIIEAFREAVLHDDIKLEKMDIRVTGTWKSSHGSGTFTTSSARREEIWLKTDHTYSFHGVRTTSVTLPPVGGSPYPQAYATSGSTSNEQGIYIVCSPNKILLLANNGRSRFARYYKDDYVLMIDGGGVYGK
jgi:hypothetical protein